MSEERVGPTGQYPQGRVSPDDQGELAIAITVKEGKLWVDFGCYAKWIAMDRPTVEGLIALLQKRLPEVR